MNVILFPIIVKNKALLYTVHCISLKVDKEIIMNLKVFT